MKYSVDFNFTGAMKCKIFFCTIDEYCCGCDTCKTWVDYETASFTDEEGATFGSIEFDESPQTKTFDICSHHAMILKLVPFGDSSCRKMKDLDLFIFGKDLGGTWSDTIMIDGQKCLVEIKVYDPANPSKVTKIPNNLEFQFKGPKKCKMVYSILQDCGCEACKHLGDCATATFADDSNVKYGVIWFETSPLTITYDICSHQVLAMNLTPFDDDTVQNATDLDLTVCGSDLGGAWEDEVKIDNKKNNVTVKVYAADPSISPPQEQSPMTKKTRRLEFTYKGPKKSKMVFTIANSCGCSNCRWWSQLTKESFDNDPDKKYGVINFETSPHSVLYNICSRHVMHMGLVSFNSKVNKAEDLDVIISGTKLNQTFKNNVKIDGKMNTVEVKVSKVPKPARTNAHLTRTLNHLELNFTGAMKSRLLYCVDPELDCDCDNCKGWISQATDTFGDDSSLRYGYINFETSPCTITYNICSNNTMSMNLVDFAYIERMTADLDMQIFGSDIGCSWTDKVTIDGCESVLKINVNSPPEPYYHHSVAAVSVQAAATPVMVVQSSGEFNKKNNSMNDKTRSSYENRKKDRNGSEEALLVYQTRNMTLVQDQRIQNNLYIQQNEEIVQVNVNNYQEFNQYQQISKASVQVNTNNYQEFNQYQQLNNESVQVNTNNYHEFNQDQESNVVCRYGDDSEDDSNVDGSGDDNDGDVNEDESEGESNEDGSGDINEVNSECDSNEDSSSDDIESDDNDDDSEVDNGSDDNEGDSEVDSNEGDSEVDSNEDSSGDNDNSDEENDIDEESDDGEENEGGEEDYGGGDDYGSGEDYGGEDYDEEDD